MTLAWELALAPVVDPDPRCVAVRRRIVDSAQAVDLELTPDEIATLSKA